MTKNTATDLERACMKNTKLNFARFNVHSGNAAVHSTRRNWSSVGSECVFTPNSTVLSTSTGAAAAGAEASEVRLQSHFFCQRVAN